MRPRLALLRLRWSRNSRGHPTNGPSVVWTPTQKAHLTASPVAASDIWSGLAARGTRPQLPFLQSPGASVARGPGTGRGPAIRWFTTQRRQWLRYEVLAFVKYTLYIWALVGCVVLGQFVVQQEWLERAHPTPPEWSFFTRMRLRGALQERGDEGDGLTGQGGNGNGTGGNSDKERIVDHVRAIQILLNVMARLEDERIDGAGVVRVSKEGEKDDGDDADDVDAYDVPLDIRAKGEPWRRGYAATLLAAAASAEHVDGWVRDRTRDLVCPPELVIGPSNPNPRPLPPSSTLTGGAPREENCAPCFPTPASLYRKLLHTRGLTRRQQLTAALAYANYLEVKEDRTAAAAIYGRAVLVAAAGGRDHDPDEASGFFYEPLPGETTTTSDNSDPADTWVQTWAHAATAGAPLSLTQNLLVTLTAYATFRARAGDIAAALPLLAALLQARQTLPPSSTGLADEFTVPAPLTLRSFLGTIFSPPTYPPPPDDGFGPPLPGPQTACEAAALRLHIGEILYASAPATSKSPSSWGFGGRSRQLRQREEGLSWTREAVDAAEEQLHMLAQQADRDHETRRRTASAATLLRQRTTGPYVDSIAAKTTCRQCLAAGLDNWAAMVAQLSRDETQRAERASAASSSSSSWPSWLTFWGEPSSAVSSSSPATDSVSSPHLHRWAAEARVIEDRRRRARELLEDPPTPASQGLLSVFSV